MSSEVVVRVENLAKCYQIYEKPSYRLWQLLFGRYKQFYREFWALKSMGFSINRGEAVGIVGLNGSGKSTLLQLICGTLHPTTGSVETYGRIAALLELGSGFNVELTGRENVFLYASLFGVTAKEIRNRFDKIEEFADIGDFINQPVKTYSTGMHVRLAFAVIANIDPEVLIIDEALSVGDAYFQQKCMRFLRQFRETGTLIFVSHDMAAVLNLCDRALWLNKGALLMDSTPNNVADGYLAHLHEIQQSESQIHSVREILDVASEEQVAIDSLKDAPSFGTYNARILKVSLIDKYCRPITLLSGGESVSLVISSIVKATVEKPIIGFRVKDRLGQLIFGNNTYLTYERSPLVCFSNEMVIATFSFVMPILIGGDYAIEVAISDGTQEKHVVLHWVYEAMIFSIAPANPKILFVEGQFAVPMEKINLSKRCIDLSKSTNPEFGVTLQ